MRSADALARLLRVIRIGSPLPILLIGVLSLLPGDERPHTGFSGQVEHLLAYSLTAAGLALGFPKRVPWIAVGLAVLAAALEIGQRWVPGRTSQLIDFAASAGGGLIGAVVGDLANLLLSRIPMLGRPTGSLNGRKPKITPAARTRD